MVTLGPCKAGAIHYTREAATRHHGGNRTDPLFEFLIYTISWLYSEQMLVVLGSHLQLYY
jgi:hypothetical protein